MAINMFDLTGKVALVTGANSGLGLAFARGLAKAGADVVIWGRREDKNAAAVKELKAFGGRVSSRVVDVTDEAEVAAGIQAAISEFGRLDTLVANAGRNDLTPFIEMTGKKFHDLLKTNLDGALHSLREGAKHMVARAQAGDAGGSLIICGSTSIFAGTANMSHYGAAKGALNSMSKAMAVELGPHGIRVNIIAPGFIITEMTQKHPDIAKVIVGMVETKAPLKRAGQPEDLEGIAVYLASDASKYHTGDTITLDGGQRANIW